MKTLVLLLSLAALSATASADQFKTIRIKHISKNIEFAIRYPQFSSKSVPASRIINTNIADSINKNASCGAEGDADDAADANADADADPFSGHYRFSRTKYFYTASGFVVALNKRYVGVRIAQEQYCGGAHPNQYTYYMTFDSNTGELPDIAHEFGFLKADDKHYNSEKQDAQRKKLAEVLVDTIPKDVESDPNCALAKSMTREEREENVDFLLYLYPVVQGLAKGNKVVFGTAPAHVAAACQFDVRLSYEQVSSLIVEGSYLHKWLQTIPKK